jgi:hypothetical protein
MLFSSLYHRQHKDSGLKQIVFWGINYLLNEVGIFSRIRCEIILKIKIYHFVFKNLYKINLSRTLDLWDQDEDLK